MPIRRPDPRRAGLGLALFLATMLFPMIGAATERDWAGPSYHGALADALTGEQAALNAFAERRLASNGGTAMPRERPDRSAAKGEAEGNPAVLSGIAPLVAIPAGKLSAETLARVKTGKHSPQWHCLAEAMYFEARGEGISGQVAVAEVILNRVDTATYPDTVCGVVRQGAADGGACQFSYNCDGKKNRVHDEDAWKLSGKIAWLMLRGRPRTLTDDALYFHNTSVRPNWSRKFVRTAKIGRHVFYRPQARK